MKQAGRTATSRNTNDIANVEPSPFLERRLEYLNRRYFDGRVEAEVVWGIPLTGACLAEHPDAASGVPAGAYATSGTIVVHPLLRDYPAPNYVVDYVVYHECLHALLPKGDDGDAHPPALMAWEAEAPKQERAKQWLQQRGFPVLPVA